MYVVPLPSERWTTTISLFGKLTPGLSSCRASSFHLVIFFR
jgi:hypothetical protein